MQDAAKKKTLSRFSTLVQGRKSARWAFKMRSLLETAFRELPKQTRGLRVPLDLLFKFLKHCGSQKSFQADRWGETWAAKPRFQVRKSHLGSPCSTFPIRLKLFSKATKLGSLFPKVNTDLSLKTAGRFQVRVENGCRIYVETHAIYAYGVCLMQSAAMQVKPTWTRLKA